MGTRQMGRKIEEEMSEEALECEREQNRRE